MKRFISFWWLCIRTAARDNSAFANDWQWLFGVPICSGVIAYLAGRNVVSELSTGYPIADAFLVALGAFVVTWFVAFAARVANAPVVLYYEEKRKAELVASRIEISFPERCNSPGTASLFKRSWSPRCAEGGSARRVSFHAFYVGIRNPSNEKKLRNVRLVMESISLGPGQVLNLSCVCDRTQTDSADIPPGGTDYFLIGEGIDESDDGIFHTKMMSRVDYDLCMATVDTSKHIGFNISTKSRSIPLLKNNGYLMDIVAYSDDTPPTRRMLTIDTRNRIEIHLGESSA